MLCCLLVASFTCKPIHQRPLDAGAGEGPSLQNSGLSEWDKDLDTISREVHLGHSPPVGGARSTTVNTCTCVICETWVIYVFSH